MRQIEELQPSTEPMLPATRVSYGGFWIRLAAYMVDSVLLLIPTYLFSFLYYAGTPASDAAEKLIVDIFEGAIEIAIWWVYIAGMESSAWQATVGKRICGLQVVGYDGGRISFARATGRYFASFLSAFFVCIGFVMIAWTRRRQGLHDLIAETMVIKSKKEK